MIIFVILFIYDLSLNELTLYLFLILCIYVFYVMFELFENDFLL